MAEVTIKYKIHEMAEAFPLPTPDEYAALKANVQAVGFINPKVMWRDKKGATWLIDGRTRDRIETELDKAGIYSAANGANLSCTVVFFEGTESEAVEYVRGLNLLRRSLTSAQRAAVAVLSGGMYARYRTKESGSELVDPEEETGDRAERLAKEAGTNRQYVFDCEKLNTDQPDLLQRVLAGTLSIPNAKKIAARRAAGLSDEPDPNEPPVTVEADPEPEEVLDAFKNPVLKELRAAFMFREKVRAAKATVKKLVAELESACEGDGGKNVSYQTIKAEAGNVVRHLEDHMPHAPCPYCSGTGKSAQAGEEKKKCPECKGRKWFDRIQWKAVPEDLRKMFEAPDTGADYGSGS